MSIRPVMSSVARAASVPSSGARLKAVLAAGKKKDAEETGVFVVPTNPGVIVPLPLVQPPIDPAQLRLVDGERQLPGLLAERREFPRALWDVLPKDLPDRVDAYGNTMRFERSYGTEILRSIKLNNGEDRFGGVLEMNGLSGQEYATRWTADETGDVIEFEGTDPVNQAIKSASFSMATMKKIAKAYSPALKETDMFKLESTMEDSAAMFEQITGTFFANGMQGDQYKSEMKKVLQFGTKFNIDNSRAEFNFDMGRTIASMLEERQIELEVLHKKLHVIADEAQIENYDPDSEPYLLPIPVKDRLRSARMDLKFKEAEIAKLKAPLDGAVPISISYYPSVQPVSWFFSPQPTAVVQLADGSVLTYHRSDVDGSLELTKTQSIGPSVGAAPSSFTKLTREEFAAKINSEFKKGVDEYNRKYAWHISTIGFFEQVLFETFVLYLMFAVPTVVFGFVLSVAPRVMKPPVESRTKEAEQLRARIKDVSELVKISTIGFVGLETFIAFLSGSAGLYIAMFQDRSLSFEYVEPYI